MTPPSSERIRAVDWLRGLSVLVMIQCHALVLLRPDLRQGPITRQLLRLDGLVAPAFLFSAGFALALLLVRGAGVGSLGQRLGRNLRRIAQVLGVATFVNWMWFPVFREPRWLVRMDILHCVGLSLLLALPVTAGLASRPRVLRGVTLGLALTTFFLSPLGEALGGPWATALNKSTGAVFPLLPWLGFVWLGTYVGAVAGERGRRGLVRSLVFVGALGCAGWLAAKPLQALYPAHRFFVTNPSNAAERAMWVCIGLLALVALESRVVPGGAPSRLRRFLETFGTSSLSAYVFHLTLLYVRVFGLCFEALWGNRCGWGLYAVLTGTLILLTYGLCRAFDALQDTARRPPWGWSRLTGGGPGGKIASPR
ncbi:heparan-alpha-glucosaminide N-acetyltransferase domain-containing protein [Archangium primigenium]|uniref:heparan-alpha-glucosaminide N-acetyltransferase domain-containing protein n=1 Tax=[Archangium] primigenium TaxID=2792470 RepID=UPI00195CD91B|nr:DUF1624 domain-containing protein [Archangium primigenium]